ncbi:helix-turn-helix domain-containing protein [Georgenia faecalis]|uniref:Helix-turn-helix domain-containing protein n=1 Tax=Georgenia faecalis TaxID=2483799 RepID=A0ABV9D588_9MICO|nr:helix-turn-helix transcriptional regulator [Georgenia faecalis]
MATAQAASSRRWRLWRNVVGVVLRETRQGRGEILSDVAARAGVSPQYLSEVERGRKEPSSEVLAAVVEALGLTLSDLTRSATALLDAAAEPRRERREPWAPLDPVPAAAPAPASTERGDRPAPVEPMVPVQILSLSAETHVGPSGDVGDFGVVVLLAA